MFKPSTVRQHERLLSTYFNSIYIQIAATMACLDRGATQLCGANIVLGSDGENGFGFNSASSNEDSELQDRDSIHSDLKYQKRLFTVVERASRDFSKSKLLKSFKKEYVIRAVYRMLRVRENLSKKDFEEMGKYYPNLWSIRLAHNIIAYMPLGIVKLLFIFKRPLEVIRGTAQGH